MGMRMHVYLGPCVKVAHTPGKGCNTTHLESVIRHGRRKFDYFIDWNEEKFSFDEGEESRCITPEQMLEQIDWFLVTRAADIDLIREAYGEISVEWGCHTYWC